VTEEWQRASPLPLTVWLHHPLPAQQLLKANLKELYALTWTQLVRSASTFTSQAVWIAITWLTQFLTVLPFVAVSETNNSSALKNNFTKSSHK
jgi:hypothetical protein